MTTPRDQLLARLRDPNAKQAFHYLRIDDCMCVGGHACDVSGLGAWEPAPGSQAQRYRFNASEAYAVGVPFRALAHFGLTNKAPAAAVFRLLPEEHRDCCPRVGYTQISQLNDSGIPLHVIADIIEAGVFDL